MPSDNRLIPNERFPIARIICKYCWAPGIFKKDQDVRHRSIKNLKSICLIVLDIDEGMTIKEAIEIIRIKNLSPRKLCLNPN